MLIALQLAAALAVQGQTPPPPHAGQERHVFVVTSDGEGPGPLDADGDGSISRAEFAAPMDAAFARMDKDGDGRLSEDELAAGGPPHGPGGGDVMVWHGEPGEGGPHRFEMRMGGDLPEGGARVEERTMVFTRGDGPGHPPVMVRHGGPGGEDEEQVMVWVSDGDGPGHPMPVGPGEHRVEFRRFGGPEGAPADIDADGDGRVTEDEFLAPMRDAFRRMDKDGSGALEGDENGGERQVHVITREGGAHHD